MNEEIIKKCEGIEQEKEDLSLIEQFDQIYSNFMVAKSPKSSKIPKIINEHDLSITTNINIEENFLDENNLFKNSNIDIDSKQFHELNKNIEKQNNNSNNENDVIENNNSKLIKDQIQINKELINNKIIENENNEKKQIKNNVKNNDRKKEKNDETNNIKIYSYNIQNNNKDIKETIKITKKTKGIKLKEEIILTKKDKKYNLNNDDKIKHHDKQKQNMKEIYKCFTIIDKDNSLNSGKKYNIKNAYERLYNQGFYTKNKSQINILNNINKIKKDSNHSKILKKSKEILGINKNNKNTSVKYNKKNIYKTFKHKEKNNNIELSFHPKINDKTKRIVGKMEDSSFTRLTKPKTKIIIKTPKKKIFAKKEIYEKSFKRINFLYLDGVEKIKKKRESNSCPPTEIPDKDIKIKKINSNSNYKLNKSSTRNIYSKQIQWKKKLIFENIKRKKIYDYYDNSECTFRPQIEKRNIKKMFKKRLSESDINTKKCKKLDELKSKIKELNISKERHFIINNSNIKKLNNNNTHLYYQKNKNSENDKRDKYNEQNIKLGLIKRKMYNLEKFFQEQNYK